MANRKSIKDYDVLSDITGQEEDIVLTGYKISNSTTKGVLASAFGGGSLYDKVIRTQPEFNTMIANPTWLDAQSVALVGEFTADASIVIPATVKQIHGFNGAKITVTAADGTVYGLSYAVRPELDKGYEIRNLEVVGTGTGDNADGYGFYSCTNLTNCTGTGTATADSYGFSDCTNLTNCTGTGTGNLYGFGYGFTNCSYCNGCKSGTTRSSTSIWGGTNLKRDDDSCELD